MILWESIAKEAYERYCEMIKSQHELSYTAMPWNSLPPIHQKAWIESIKYATDLAIKGDLI